MQPRLVRRQQVRISCELIQQLITTDADSASHQWGARCVAGVPADAQLVQCYVDGTVVAASMLVMVFEHEAWPAVSRDAIPILVPEFKEYRRSSADSAQEDSRL